MAFAKRTLHGSPSIQGFNPSSIELLGFKGHHSSMLEEGECSEALDNYTVSHQPTLFDPSNLSSSCFTFGSVMNYTPIEAQSVVSFKSAAEHRASSSSSVFDFEQGDHTLHANNHLRLNDEEECASWIDAMDQSYQLSRITQDQNCLEMASGYGSTSGTDDGQERFGLLYPTTTAIDTLQKSVGHERGSQKRPFMDHDVPASKKQCSNARKTKSKPTSAKDPQSIAAKNRRERISERLKILQELVPNGTKVDLVTMLEKAINYVKFLQLQVKVLATDEFWPAQGGKAPEVAQVKETIDAILSSYRDRSSTSKQ